MNIGALLLVLAGGALAGHLLRNRRALASANRTATRYALGLLLLFMGTKLAQNRHVFAQDLGSLLGAAASALLLTGVYFLAFHLLGRLRRAPSGASPEAQEGAPEAPHEWVAVAGNAAWIASGFLLYLLLPARLTQGLPVDAVADWLLRLLLLLIGFDLGVECHRMDFRGLSLPVLLFPLLNIAGTLACGALFSLLRGLPLRQGLLLHAGMGWYSLSSVLLAQHGWAMMALMAFIHNVFRELLAILTAPMAARVSPHLPIFLGGATSMDVMLPFVQRYSGRAHTLAAFYSGLVCSLAVLPLVRALL